MYDRKPIILDYKCVSQFWRYVLRCTTSDHWLWVGPTEKLWGYGRVEFRRKNIHINYKAHRVSYAIHYPQVDLPQWIVCHFCDIPTCVNPEHLFHGTDLDNVLDKMNKGRYNGRALITDQDVLDIRHAVANGDSQISQARKYLLDHRTISAIINRTNWKHLP